MGTTKESQKEDHGKPKMLADDKKLVSLFAPTPPQIQAKAIAKVTNSRTQLFILFMVIFLLVNHVDWFRHPTNSMISNIRM